MMFLVMFLCFCFTQRALQGPDASTASLPPIGKEKEAALGGRSWILQTGVCSICLSRLFVMYAIYIFDDMCMFVQRFC